MKILQTIEAILARIVEWSLVIILIGIVALGFLQVLTRYVFSSISIPWTEEVARLLFIWGCFLGTGLLVVKKRVIRVDFITSRLPQKSAEWLNLVMDLAMLFFSLLLIFKGFEFTNSIAEDRFTLLGHPRNWFWLPIPLSAIIMSIALVRSIWEKVSSIATSKVAKGSAQ